MPHPAAQPAAHHRLSAAPHPCLSQPHLTPVSAWRRLAYLSGPSFAAEVGRGNPTAVTVASESDAAAQRVQVRGAGWLGMGTSALWPGPGLDGRCGHDVLG